MKFTPRRVPKGDMFPISQPRQKSTKSALSLPSRPRNPALLRLHKYRTIILPILLVLAFTTLVLGAIYAYCVAKPHTDIADRLAVDGNAEADSSLFGKRAIVSVASSSASNLSSRDIDAETALLFYTMTTPGVSLFHLSFELIMHHHTPQYLSLRRTYIIFLTASSLLLAGWLTTLSFWMHCELPSLNKTGQAVCPAQVRGHFMYGIHEVSIAKAAVGWVVAVLYAAHVALLAMGFRAQRRAWRVKDTSASNAGGDVQIEMAMEHGEAREVVVRFALDKDANVI